jgi:hypothetical protein
MDWAKGLSFQTVTDLLQVLAGITVEAVQMLYQICHMINCRSFFVGGVPNSSRLKGSWYSLPNTRLANVKLILLCLDTLLTKTNKSSLICQCFCCELTAFHRCSSIVWLYCSTMQSACSWKGMEHVLFTPRHHKTTCIRCHYAVLV